MNNLKEYFTKLESLKKKNKGWIPVDQLKPLQLNTFDYWNKINEHSVSEFILCYTGITNCYGICWLDTLNGNTEWKTCDTRFKPYINNVKYWKPVEQL